MNGKAVGMSGVSGSWRGMRSLLTLRHGGTAYGAARFAAAGAQLLLAVVATRILPEADLGRFTVSVVTATTANIFFGSSLRRLTMYRDHDADLSDVKVVAALGGFCSVFAAAAICWLAFDVRTAACAALLTSARAADSYADIAQGVWCLDARLRLAGLALTLRMATSTAVTCLLFRPIGLLPALGVGLVVRLAFALVETSRARRQAFVLPRREVALKTVGFGLYVSLVAGIVTLVDTVPTIGVTKAAGLSGAGILTPLGRIRFAFILLATTLGEIYYGDMARAARTGASVGRVTLETISKFLVLVLVSAPLALFGGAALVFGQRLQGHSGLIALCLVAGAAMGLNNLVSIGLTARARIAVQLVAYGLAAFVAGLGTWLSGWSIRGLFLSEIAGCGCSLVVIAAASRVQFPHWRERINDRAETNPICDAAS